jgi:hypothetical protein
LNLVLTRWSTSEDGTFGTLDGIPGFTTPLATCERDPDDPDCKPIPAGIYPCDWAISPRLTKVHGVETFKYHVRNVPNNPGILLHGGNFETDSKGCILLGKQMSVDTLSGRKEIIHSREAVAEFEKAMAGQPFTLEVKWAV